MTRPDPARRMAMGCAPVVVAMVLLGAANAIGWITLPWAWFFLPVWLPFLVVAVLLGVFVVAAWAWLVLLAAWAAFCLVAHRLRRAWPFRSRPRPCRVYSETRS